MFSTNFFCLRFYISADQATRTQLNPVFNYLSSVKDNIYLSEVHENLLSSYPVLVEQIEKNCYPKFVAMVEKEKAIYETTFHSFKTFLEKPDFSDVLQRCSYDKKTMKLVQFLVKEKFGECEQKLEILQRIFQPTEEINVTPRKRGRPPLVENSLGSKKQKI